MSQQPFFGKHLFSASSVEAGIGGPPNNDDDNGSLFAFFMLVFFLSTSGLLDALGSP